MKRVLAIDPGQLVAAIGGTDAIYFATIDGAPWSKGRPRFSRKGHTYVRKEDREAEDSARVALREAFPDPFTGNVALACVFYRPNFQRIDVDNMLKHICDAATGILWEDDSQVTAVVGTAYLDTDNPHTDIAVASHVTTLTRGTDALYPCAVCGTLISRIGQKGASRKTCSRECSIKVRGFPGLMPVECPGCGEKFRRATSTQKFCSHTCYADHISGSPMPQTKSEHRCWQCGSDIRRPGRCRRCWRADPSAVQPDAFGASA